MIIKPDASTDEYSSPFFKLNEKFCLEFENFVMKKIERLKESIMHGLILFMGKLEILKLGL